MRCNVSTRLLQLYVDNRLPLDRMRSLEMHLADCPACREELFLLKEVDTALKGLEMVTEPADLTANVMKRVALNTQQQRWQQQEKIQRHRESFRPFHPSLTEILTAVVLATVTMLVIVVELPVVRHALRLPGGRGPLMTLFLSTWNALISINTDTLMTLLWILGTVLGVWITLIVAGAEMRNQWFKAVMDRLPVRL